MFLLRLFEESETACAMSSQIFSAWRGQNFERYITYKTQIVLGTDSELVRLQLLTFTVSQLKKWMSGFFCAALWQTNKRSDGKCFSELTASQR